MSDVSISF